MIVSEQIGEKALRLLDQNRVRVWLSEGDLMGAIVSGDSGFHTIHCQADRVWCDCPAWKPDRYCSHAVAAMVAWGEHG